MPKKTEPLKALKEWWKPIAFLFGAVILTGATVKAWDGMRPYVTVEEGVAFAVQSQELHDAQEVQLEILAGISCETQIKIIKAELRVIKRDLIVAQAAENVTAIRVLLDQIDDVEEDLKKVKRRCGLG